MSIEVRRTTVGLVIAASLLLTLVGALVAANGVPAWERCLFTWVNDLPDGFSFVEVPMQLGGLGVLPALAIAIGWATRRWSAAISLVVAEITAWFVANQLKHVVERARPALLLDGVEVRTAAAGFGFPSTHAAVAAAAATVVALWVPRGWRWLPIALAAIVAFARVFTGVHLPLDVVGGAAIGVAAGTGVDALVGVRSPR